jgi:hypothetical protein
MIEVRVTIEGRSYLTFEGLSECYGCSVSWLHEAYEFGLLGRGRRHGGRVVFSMAVLDRVADVIRLARHQGLAFETIVVLIGESEPEPRFDEIGDGE